MTQPTATYLLPLRTTELPDPELVEYLRGLSQILPVIVVDGSAPAVFEGIEELLPFVRHVAPEPALRCLNGKVHGVLTGIALAETDVIVIADDDVRYGAGELAAVREALIDADLVRPQNWFDPAPWHAVWDTARTLLNRVSGGDMPGTLAVRTSAVKGAGGYDGNVLFENLELIRTIEAAGGVIADRPDLYVVRRPPTARHFLGQRSRQAYDELARPPRLVAQLGIVPLLGLLVRRRRWGTLAALGLAAVGAAEVGRRRCGGRTRFRALASVCAPGWLVERGVCAWLAVGLRLRGGVPYAGSRLVRAATPLRILRARRRTAMADDLPAPSAAAPGRATEPAA
jgi:hypothetical protein